MTELVIEKYKIQRTGTDGGRNYVLTQIDFDGIQRGLVITFADKSNEPEIRHDKPITVKGEIKDDGIEYDLIMVNAKMINKVH